MRGGGRGRGRGTIREWSPGPHKEAVEAVLRLREDGDLDRFVAVAGEDLNRELEYEKYRKITPFLALLEGLNHGKRLTSPEGVAAIRRAVSDFGATWKHPQFTKLLTSIIELSTVAQGKELIEFAVATGALWVSEDGVYYHGSFTFHVLVESLLKAGVVEEPESLELLERSLAESRVDQPMTVMLEGGGTLFSELIRSAATHGVLGTPTGDILINMAMRYGADWATPDGWNQTPFEEVIFCSLRSKNRPERMISPESAVTYLQKVLETHPCPSLLWNSTTDRSSKGHKDSTGALPELLKRLAENNWVGQPCCYAFLHLAETTGARWDAIHWNYSPPWSWSGVGSVSNFHVLVHYLGHAGALDHSAGVDIVVKALENGADYAIDDPKPPGAKRFVVDIPNLVWERRRETVRLLALLVSGRAQLATSETEDKEGRATASCLVALASFVQLAKHTSATQVTHPIVRSVMSFLPRVPLVLGYEFTDFRKNEIKPWTRPAPV